VFWAWAVAGKAFVGHDAALFIRTLPSDVPRAALEEFLLNKGGAFLRVSMSDPAKQSQRNIRCLVTPVAPLSSLGPRDGALNMALVQVGVGELRVQGGMRAGQVLDQQPGGERSEGKAHSTLARSAHGGDVISCLLLRG
jgi:hypothetical protein